jgi:hypothetical protein
MWLQGEPPEFSQNTKVPGKFQNGSLDGSMNETRTALLAIIGGANRRAYRRGARTEALALWERTMMRELTRYPE